MTGMTSATIRLGSSAHREKESACDPGVPARHSGHEAVPAILRRCYFCAVRARRCRAGRSARRLAVQPAAACAATPAEDRGSGYPQDGRTAQALLRADRAAKILRRARQQMPR